MKKFSFFFCSALALTLFFSVSSCKKTSNSNPNGSNAVSNQDILGTWLLVRIASDDNGDGVMQSSEEFAKNTMVPPNSIYIFNSNGTGTFKSTGVTDQNLTFQLPNNTTLNLTVNSITTTATLDTLNSNIFCMRTTAGSPSKTTWSIYQKINTTMKIGQSYQGGIIFYLAQPGDSSFSITQQHGLIVAAQDQAVNCLFSYDKFSNIDATVGYGDTANGAGMRNTTNIVSKCPGLYCSARYGDTLGIGGYNDWYIPSLNELRNLYKFNANYSPNNLGMAATDYWSSSAYLNPSDFIDNSTIDSVTFQITHHYTYAVYGDRLNFSNGSWSPSFGTANVRAIRSF